MSESSPPAQLFLLINGNYYRVERIPFEVQERESMAKGWKLRPLDDPHGHGPYSVIRQPSGRITCECADFTFVGQREQRPCKHILKVQEAGLLS